MKGTENAFITVSNMADITAPIATLTLKDNWNKFWNGITFRMFFNKTQTFTINAVDVNTSSGYSLILLSNEERELSSIYFIGNNSLSLNIFQNVLVFELAAPKICITFFIW